MDEIVDREAETENSRPSGLSFLEYVRGSAFSFKTNQIIVLVLTFLSYASYHSTRKTMSIIKSVLVPDSSEFGSINWLKLYIPATKETEVRSGWPPFDTPQGTAMLGEIDVAFLAVYAFGMYFAGHLGDRVDLRIVLTLGMLGTGAFTCVFGAGYWLNIHSFYYFLAVQMMSGLFQSSGWPSVVAVVGNWFGKSKRGLIMGVWNAHTSIGNISGSLIAAALLRFGWGWSVAVPGFVIALMGLVVFLFLPVSPRSLGLDTEGLDRCVASSSEKTDCARRLLEGKSEVRDKSIGFMEAWRIPGVAPFAFCLFFSKLVAYTFLYWLPFYISHTDIGGTDLADSTAGTLSTLFDVGGVVGGILAGHISDKLDARALTAASFMYTAIPALYLYRIYGNISVSWNVVLMFVTGMLVNGPYALISTAVSADLGTHHSLNGNSRALATVTAIIDGTGSVGAAVGPLLTGYLSGKSWTAVFTMLMLAALVAGLLLTRLVIAEVSAKMEASRMRGANRFQAHLV